MQQSPAKRNCKNKKSLNGNTLCCFKFEIVLWNVEACVKISVHKCWLNFLCRPLMIGQCHRTPNSTLERQVVSNHCSCFQKTIDMEAHNQIWTGHRDTHHQVNATSTMSVARSLGSILLVGFFCGIQVTLTKKKWLWTRLLWHFSNRTGFVLEGRIARNISLRSKFALSQREIWRYGDLFNFSVHSQHDLYLARRIPCH